MQVKSGWVAAATIAAATLAAVVPALATPGSGFVPTPLSLGVMDAQNLKADKTDKWDLFLLTKAPSAVGVDNLVVQPGGFSGWHTHAGVTFVTVKSGSVIWTDGVACSATTYGAGSSFVEPANHLHNVRSVGGAELIAVQMRPPGTAGRIDASAPTRCQNL